MEPLELHIRMLVDEARGVVDLVVYHDIQVLLGVVLRDVGIGELLLRHGGGLVLVSIKDVDSAVSRRWWVSDESVGLKKRGRLRAGRKRRFGCLSVLTIQGSGASGKHKSGLQDWVQAGGCVISSTRVPRELTWKPGGPH